MKSTVLFETSTVRFLRNLADFPLLRRGGGEFKSRHPDYVKGLNFKIWAFFNDLKKKSTVLSTFLTDLVKLQLITKTTAEEFNMPEKNENKNYPYIPCRLQDYDGDIAKTWYIRYYIYNVDRKALQKKDITRFNKNYPTVDKRRAAAKKIMREIDSLLEKGATTYDGKFKENKTERKIEIVNVNAIIAFRFALERTKATLDDDTVRGKRLAIDHYEAFLKLEGIEHLYFQSIEPENIYLFSDYLINDVIIGNKTHNNYKGYLSSLYNFYKKIYPDKFPVNPFEVVENKKTETGDGHTPFSDKQVEEIKKYLIANKKDRLLTFIQFLYFSFLRPRKELRLLKIKDIKSDSIFVRAANAKDDEGVHIKIPTPLEKLIKENKFRDYPENFYVFGREGFKSIKDAQSVVRWEKGFAFDKDGFRIKTYKGYPGPEATGKNYFYDHHKKMLIDLSYDDNDHDLYSYKPTGNIKLFIASNDLHLIKEQNRHSTLEQTEKYLRGLGLFVDGSKIKKFPKF